VETKTYADATSAAYTYDAAGRLKTRRDGMNRTTTYSYNPYNLPTTIDYPSNPDVTFAYSPQGQRLTMNDGSGTTSWTYDSIGRVDSETQGRSHRSVRYQYDVQSNRVGMEIVSTDTPSNPWQTTYAFDNASRLRTVLDSRTPTGTPFVYTYVPG